MLLKVTVGGTTMALLNFAAAVCKIDQEKDHTNSKKNLRIKKIISRRVSRLITKI
jgi:hypothetical protein